MNRIATIVTAFLIGFASSALFGWWGLVALVVFAVLDEYDRRLPPRIDRAVEHGLLDE